MYGARSPVNVPLPQPDRQRRKFCARPPHCAVALNDGTRTCRSNSNIHKNVEGKSCDLQLLFLTRVLGAAAHGNSGTGELSVQSWRHAMLVVLALLVPLQGCIVGTYAAVLMRCSWCAIINPSLVQSERGEDARVETCVKRESQVGTSLQFLRSDSPSVDQVYICWMSQLRFVVLTCSHACLCSCFS